MYDTGNPTPVLCDLEEWDGEGGGKGSSTGQGHMYI